MVDFEKVSIVIPAYNEESTIGELLERIFKVSKHFEVIVCSDGSQDKTDILVKEKGAKLIKHPYNIGNGAAVKSGALAATREFLVLMDADLQHQPEDIPKLLEYLPDYDMVVGARTNESKTALHRNIGNRLLTTIAQNISGHKIDDLTSGFRVVKKDAFLRFAHLYPLGYSYPSTSTLAFFASGYFVRYVPLATIAQRKYGKSNISPFKDGLKFLHIIIRIIMTFHPQRIFFPFAFLLCAAGVAMSTYQLMHGGGIRSLGVIFLLSSIVVFLNGILAEQLAELRRDLYPLSQRAGK